MTVIIPVAGHVSTTALTNLRQGAANTKSPIVRKLAAGTMLSVTGLTVGEAVAQNAQWYRTEDGNFVWSGACTSLTSTLTPITTPTTAAQTDPRVARFGFEPAFAAKLVQLLDACAAHGLEFKVSQGLRTPQIQAKYFCGWDQRSPATIHAEADKLDAAGAPWTADLMRSLADMKRQAAWQTSQLPGSGWHQWGEAADCYCYRDGHMVSSGSDPCYKQYADLAQGLGLTAGYYFSKSDPGHVQLRPAAGATSLYSWSEIDASMKARFGDKPHLT